MMISLLTLDWKVIVIKKHMLALLGLVMIILYCETSLMRHYQERVKMSAIRSCPLYKLVFRRFGPISLKSPTNNFYQCYFCAVR